MNIFFTKLFFNKKKKPVSIQPTSTRSMQGAGVSFKNKQYVTHTTLHHSFSALETFLFNQKLFFFLILEIIFFGLITDYKITLLILIALLSLIYSLDVAFNFFVTLQSLRSFKEISSTKNELDAIDEKSLPVYSILCPLYKEAHVIPQFLDAITKLDYQKTKLDVLLLLEEDDVHSIQEVEKMSLPKFVRVVVVPDSYPKTKPKACNYGLSFAKGEYLVVYDAEDMPDPLQLKKAYLAFQKVKKDVICLQAKLNYYNPHQNLLTRFFTAEYSLWFEITLTGLQAINTTIPLGGTSNHFRTRDLKKLEGWDPFNVTEDADLGVRLFRKGFKTAIIDSTTLEEANSRVGNWFRQRSRWIKGYMQTYLVHTRENFGFKNARGIHGFIFHLIVGGKLAFIFINPLLWIVTIIYFVLRTQVGYFIESLYPAAVFYIAIFSLIFGNFLFMYYYMIGCAKRGQWELIKYVLLIPIYWICISIAGVIAFYQLLLKPHYWEKTVHGFHIPTVKVLDANVWNIFNPKLAGSQIFVGALLIGNALNFLYNAYLSRSLTTEEFGLIGLIGSFIYIAQIPFGALSRTVTHKSALLLGKFNTPAKGFWKQVRSRSVSYGWFAFFAWIIATPFIANFFRTQQLLPFLLFSPIIVISIASSVDMGFLTGNLRFKVLALMTVVEAATKLVITTVLVSIHVPQLVLAAIPLSTLTSFIIGYSAAKEIQTTEDKADMKKHYAFPKPFFSASMLTKISAMMFLSLDVILARHFLSAKDAGEYVLLSLLGKIIFLFGSLMNQFITPLVSRSEGEKKNSYGIFYTLLLATTVLSIIVYIPIGLFGSITAPILFGQKTANILQFLPWYGISVVLFTLASSIVSFHELKYQYNFSFLSVVFALVEVGGISLYHTNISAIVGVSLIASTSYFVSVSFLHIVYSMRVASVPVVENIKSFFGLFGNSLEVNQKDGFQRILILNWRDTKHIWAGGAEVYIHQIAKRWVEKGYKVTVFSGNDGKNPRNQNIDGVQIIRRGGFYTVYFWAFLYYMLRLKRHTDIIVDCENGIPFFTPLYAKKPIVLLIHHIHQEVFRKHLPFGVSHFAQFLEKKCMPFAYKNNTVITVSESSKKDIMMLGLGTQETIFVVHPGIDLKGFLVRKKTIHPSFLYLGRLKSYKNIEIAIQAFYKIVKKFPSSTFTIAGFGEELETLKKLVKKLGLENFILFLGTVSETLKKDLLSKSWVMIQPSMLEGWGITVIEANASHTPVIASRVNGLRDSVIDKKTGLLVKPNDVDELSQAMALLLSNKKLRENYSDEAFIWAGQFSWEKSAHYFLSILLHIPMQKSHNSLSMQVAI